MQADFTVIRPVVPGQQEPVWSVEAKIEFDGTARAAVVNFDIPDDLVLVDPGGASAAGSHPSQRVDYESESLERSS